MKRIFQHPEGSNGKRYWRSLNELADKPEFKEWLHREFPAGASELETDGLSRRGFLRLMGASMALAGLGMAGCRRPEAFLVPYTKSPEWIVPGKALQYATSMPRRFGGVPLLATVVDGRPIKLDGNPGFPGANGGSDIFTQGAILDLYDPDRSKEFKKNGQVTDAKAFADELDKIAKTFEANKGEGLAFLTENITSPTLQRLRKEVEKKFPAVRWASYEPLGNQNELEAAQTAFGGRYQTVPKYDKADVILSLDCDFLASEDGGAAAIKGFSTGRRRVEGKDGKMNRLYVVESRFSLTGGMADHRLRLNSSQITAFMQKLVQAVANTPVDDKWISELAKDLQANKGKCLVVAGSQQPVAVHLLALLINLELNNFGQTALIIPSLTEPSLSINQLATDINAGKVNTLFILGGNPVFNAPAELNWAETQKKVTTVIRHSLHEDETSALATWQIPAAHFLETWGDDRARDGSYLSRQPMILPLWGGISEAQILIGLLVGSLPRVADGKGHTIVLTSEIVNGVAISLPIPATEGPEQVQETFKQITKSTGDIADSWRQFVHDGFLSGSGVTESSFTYSNIKLSTLIVNVGLRVNLQLTKPQLQEGECEVTFYAANIDDGRYINNGWLQELPEPMTKLTWDNAALISVALAKKLGIEMPGSASGLSIPGVLDPIDKPNTNVAVQSELGNKNGFPFIELTVNGRKLVLPALISPGQADNSIAIAVGYGRTATGHVGKGSGFNAYSIRTSDTTGFVTGVKVAKVSGSYPLAITQEHNSMEGRGLAREIVLEENRKNPGWVQQIGESSHMPGYKEGFPAIYAADQPKLDGLMQWGMVIDLNTCIGCNACTIACQAENNIPIVGKQQVINGREMHWIRNDRYFSGDVEDPQAIVQPVACMQCENAPCETVCPVNATVHSDEGLNVMAYNRCIGTRYCANNCPYKVRRFNFFSYNERPIDKLYWGPLAKKGSPDTIKMQKNPNVTVRMRGVMEKCTFCVQRIEEAKIGQLREAKDSNKTIVKANSFQTACQQVCPAEAIVFGDIKNPESEVSKLKAHPRNYAMLDYLGVKPRLSYLGRVRNPNPAMPGAEKVGTASPIEEGGHEGGGEHGHNAAPGASEHGAAPAVEGGHH
jgi:MoCo/4Fe-4S cofactor protein with predicted Tat translocation signal